MNKVLYILLYVSIVSLNISCKSRVYEQVDYYEDGQIRSIQYFDDTKQNDLIKKLVFYQNGDTSELVEYNNGKEYSKYIYDSITGSKYYLQYKDSLLHGIAKKVDNNGFVFISHFNNGVLYGKEAHIYNNDTTEVLWWINGKLLLAEEINRLNIGDTIQNIITVGSQVIEDSIRVINKKADIKLIKEYYYKGERSKLIGVIEYNNNGMVMEEASNYYSINSPASIKFGEDLNVEIQGHFQQYESFRNMEVVLGDLRDDFSIDVIDNRIVGEHKSQSLSLTFKDIQEGYNVFTGNVLVHFQNDVKTMPLIFDVNVE